MQCSAIRRALPPAVEGSIFGAGNFVLNPIGHGAVYFYFDSHATADSLLIDEEASIPVNDHDLRGNCSGIRNAGLILTGGLWQLTGKRGTYGNPNAEKRRKVGVRQARS